MVQLYQVVDSHVIDRPLTKDQVKEAIMEVSDYKTKDYRDIMMEIKLQEEKPLTIKKD